MLVRPLHGIFLLLLTIVAISSPTPQQPSITAPFLLNHNRVFVDLDFIRPDGTSRRARAFVDMGAPDLTFTAGLMKELQFDHQKTWKIRLGGVPLRFDEETISAEYVGLKTLTPAGIVEASLPALILMNYDVVFDYKARTMTLAAPGTIRHEGVRIPCRVNPKTGLISIDVGVGSQTYAVTIDNGSAYTWIARPVVSSWVEKHPAWLRGVGAIGDANMNGTDGEVTALLARIPSIQIGPLELRDVGLAGYAQKVEAGKEEFFDWYSKKSPEPVIGFIGGNILKSFRIEVDYANGATYWVQEADIDSTDMNQVPLVMRPGHDGGYTVVGICERNGKRLIDGILPGDKLIRIGDLTIQNATFGTVLQALHGRPGDTRDLVVERQGRRFQIAAKVADL